MRGLGTMRLRQCTEAVKIAEPFGHIFARENMERIQSGRLIGSRSRDSDYWLNAIVSRYQNETDW